MNKIGRHVATAEGDGEIRAMELNEGEEEKECQYVLVGIPIVETQAYRAEIWRVLQSRVHFKTTFRNELAVLLGTHNSQ